MICADCGQEKLHHAKGLCRACYHHRWYIEHREENLAYQRRWQDENKERLRASRQRQYMKHREERRAEQLRIKYGITVDEYNEMLDSQGGKCKICGGDGRLVIDHDHDTGRIRGLLCSNCNSALGLVGENPKIFRGMIVYLEESPPN